ncbi:MAG: peptidoglycan-binding domain-containing protein [Rhizomicrobium sp.]
MNLSSPRIPSAGLVLITLIAASCTQTPKPAPVPAPVVAPPPAPAPAPVVAAPKIDHELVFDERAIAAAQRALSQLGYDAGKADGVGGPATRRAILAFQKDHDLAQDGRLTFAVAEKIRAALQAESARTAAIEVRQGDMLVYSDGVVEVAAAERMVQWDQEDTHGLVAIRPAVTGWPAAARAGLDWAITHALDVPASAKPVKWSSTGVEQHFEIYTYPALTPREAALVGGDPGSCRRFEMRTAETQWRYPAIACRDVKGAWYIPHSTIRLARPATGLGTSPGKRK